MSRVKKFDVLIVYNGATASSASVADTKTTTPFKLGSKHESYNAAYGYFLATCRKLGLAAAFTTSADIIGAGLCQSYWRFARGKWHKVDAPCYSTSIFDKFSPKNKVGRVRRNLLFSSKHIKPYNDPTLYNLFFDKQKTYTKLSAHAIPTISMTETTLKSIKKSCTHLTNFMLSHAGAGDFSSDIVMKDRFGAGGNHVYKFKADETKKIQSIMRANKHISFIIQPFAKFDKGFSYNNIASATDIRLIYLKGKIIQSYIRIAKSGDFRCNDGQGATSTYLTRKEIPQEILTKAITISTLLNNQQSLYALDFIITNSGTSYFLEGNTGPGLGWNKSIKKETVKAKHLIRTIVKELLDRSEKIIPTHLTNLPLPQNLSNQAILRAF